MTYLSRVTSEFLARHSFKGALAVALSALLGVAAGRLVASVGGVVSVVEGSSMAPNFQPGARLFALPLFQAPERGDVVLLEDGRGGCALKRIVGLPGETVHLWRGYVFINRKMLREPYLPKYTFTDPDEKSGRFVFELGSKEYFVLGDNRVGSVDSRAYGPVKLSQIKSRISLPDNTVRAGFAPYTLPELGKRTIRPLNSGTTLRNS